MTDSVPSTGSPESTFEQSFENWMDLSRALHEQSALGAVLITTSYFDAVLRRILESYLVVGRANKSLFEDTGAALSTFSAKINLAYAMGLISNDESKQLHAMRKIRNTFAHSVKTTFSDDDVIKAMQPLIARHGIAYDYPGTFTFAASTLTTALLNRADHAKKTRLTEQEWDIRRTDFDEDGFDPY